MPRTRHASEPVALFVTTFAVSATANSGYAIIAAMRHEFVGMRVA